MPVFLVSFMSVPTGLDSTALLFLPGMEMGGIQLVTLVLVPSRPGDATTAAHVPFAAGWTTRLFATSAGSDVMMEVGAMEEGGGSRLV